MRTIRNLLSPTCTRQTIAIHTSKGPVRSERVIATYLYIPALLEMSKFDKETTIFFKYRPSVCHWANRKYQKLDWVSVFIPSLSVAVLLLLLLPPAFWRTLPDCCWGRGWACGCWLRRLTNGACWNQTNKKWNEKHFYICWNRFFFIISFGVNSLEKKTKEEKRENSFLFPVLNKLVQLVFFSFL